jgi:tetratricopeptide (TPR) repeat protein
MLLPACSFRRRAWLLLLASACLRLAAAPVDEAAVQHIYERLVHAAGVINPPKLVIEQYRPGAADRVAFLRTVPGPLPRRELVIDDKTVAICRTMGAEADSCLAYFLGHELAHFANHHNWEMHFAQQQLNDDLTPEESIRYETQADRFGGLYAALAGYDSLSVAARALALVYRDYGISPNLPGYLSLSEREKLPENARAFLSGLLPMFDAAGLLMALGDYQPAAALYDAILDQFPSREIYNNAGVALASCYNPSIPWLLDGSTRLPGKPSRGEADLADLAARARDHFETAISLDRDYAVAHLNLGLLLKALGNEPERADAELKTAVRLSPDNPAIAAIARGEQPPAAASAPPGAGHIDVSGLLPGGKRPAELVPARPDPVVRLSGGFSFFTRTMNGLTVVSIGPIGPDNRKVIAVLVPQVPVEWRGHLGEGREVPLFPQKAMLYPQAGVLIGVRGALVYQVR